MFVGTLQIAEVANTSGEYGDELEKLQTLALKVYRYVYSANTGCLNSQASNLSIRSFKRARKMWKE